jgi:imidazolonepropionase-like amidohydrolase
VTALCVRGPALPDGDVVELSADGDRWTTDPVHGAQVVVEGWLLPGLVDAHTHPGTARPGDDLDDDLLRTDLEDHLRAGVTAVRAPGLAGNPPTWFGRDPGLPRGVHAGPWIARPGQFLDGWGRRATLDEMPAVAAEQANRTGWAKLIGDWRQDDPALPLPVLRAAVEAVHAVGGRLAVHAQTAVGAAAAARAGVDSVEHGQGLDPELLPAMAASGVALTPTLTVIEQGLARRRAAGQGAEVPYVATARAHPALAAAAWEAGVTVLAGTDARPHGRVAVEIRALHAAGLSAHAALGAGSWAARAFLGLPGLVAGAPADAVVYPEDPRTDLRVLDHPTAVVLRGRLIRPRG